MAGETVARPFAELPSALVEEALSLTQTLGEQLLATFESMRIERGTWRSQLDAAGFLQRDANLPYVSPPTTCGIDGSYAVERLLTVDLVAAAAVAVEGLTPPSEKRFWPEPYHLVWIKTEMHEAETGSILRALMMGMELELAASAPHEVVLIDGSFTTPLIYFNQALSQAREKPHLQVAQRLVQTIQNSLKAYHTLLSSSRTDRCWLAIPKYSTRREIGQHLEWPENFDDRGILSLLLEPGEFTSPMTLQQPSEPWHLGLGDISPELRTDAEELSRQITEFLQKSLRVVYYRPFQWLPALRLEMGRAVAENTARLATVLHAVKHQCGTPSVMEPYPLYMADRMVKHLPKAIPTFRQMTSQWLAETYQGDISDVFLGLHGYRTESGQ